MMKIDLKNKPEFWSILRNKTYTYICPILVPYINIIKDNLLNTYIGDVDHPELDNNIFLLYNFENTERHIAYEAYLQTLSIFVNMYEPTENTTMFVFKVPKAYQKIYNLYKKGKYSKFPKTYKEQIFRFHRISSTNHRVYQVLNKDERLYQELEEKLGADVPRDIDPSSIPNMEEECFNKLLFNQQTDFKVIDED